MTRRAVVVGSGSAGRRHATALRTLRPDLAVTVVRRPESLGAMDALVDLGVDVVPDLAEALSTPPDLGIVAGPAPMHAEATVRLLGAGATVLVEKPLAADLAAADTIAAAAARARRPVVLGYHLRFGSILPALHRLVRDGSIGVPVGFRLEVGQHLAGWRPGTDARRSVSARAELGGGVLLELSHELDALRVLLDTEVREVRTTRLRTDGAPTDGIVETEVDLELVTTSGAAGSVHLDMTSEPAFRRWQVRGSEATVTADLLTGTIELQGNDGPPRHVEGGTRPSGGGERLLAEEQLIRHLLAVDEGSATSGCSVSDGIAVLGVIAAARSSWERGDAVAVPDRRSVPT